MPAASEIPGKDPAIPVVRLLVVGIAVVIFGTASLFQPLSTDQGYFAYIGRTLVEGGLPYRDAWDVKPPGLLFVYGLSAWLMGTKMMAIRVFELVWQALTALVVGAIAQRTWKNKTMGTIAAVCYFVGYYMFAFYDTANSEGMLSLPLALGTLLALRASENKKSVSWALAGCSVAVACLFKLTVGIILPVLMLAPLVESDSNTRVFRFHWQGARLLRSGMVLLGFLVPMGLCAAFFVIKGGWKELIDTQFVVVPHMAAGWMHQVTLLWVAKAFLAHFPNRWFKILTLLAVAMAGILAYRREHSLQLWLVIAWLGAGVFSLFLQARFWWYHYMPLLGPLSVLASLALWMLYRECLRANHFLAKVTGGLVLLGSLYAVVPKLRADLPPIFRMAAGQVSLADHYASFREDKTDNYSFRVRMEVADYVARRTTPSDTIFVWGYSPVIYLLANRHSPSRFTNHQPLYAVWGVEEYKQEFLRTLREAPPAVFVVQSNDSAAWVTGVQEDSKAVLEKFGELRKLIEEGYRLDREINNFQIYKRIAPRPAKSPPG